MLSNDFLSFGFGGSCLSATLIDSIRLLSFSQKVIVLTRKGHGMPELENEQHPAFSKSI